MLPQPFTTHFLFSNFQHNLDDCQIQLLGIQVMATITNSNFHCHICVSRTGFYYSFTEVRKKQRLSRRWFNSASFAFSSSGLRFPFYLASELCPTLQCKEGLYNSQSLFLSNLLETWIFLIDFFFHNPVRIIKWRQLFCT